MFALHTAGRLHQQGVRPLYLDYEMDAGEHRNRLEYMFGAARPGVRYMRATRPLAYGAGHDEHVAAVIVLRITH